MRSNHSGGMSRFLSSLRFTVIEELRGAINTYVFNLGGLFDDAEDDRTKFISPPITHLVDYERQILSGNSLPPFFGLAGYIGRPDA